MGGFSNRGGIEHLQKCVEAHVEGETRANDGPEDVDRVRWNALIH